MHVALALKVNPMMPTQVAHPKRTSWRTFVQTLLALLPTANGILLTVQALIAAPPYNDVVPPWMFALVNFAVVTAAFLAKVLSQIMANPVVNRWIETHWPGLAPAPLSSETVGGKQPPSA
jgi:hypothetical protein